MLNDILREIAIRLVTKLAITTTLTSRWAWNAQKRLLLGRSARQVARMERVIGSR